MDELAKQAPYLFALVIVIIAFLQAQAKRDEAYLKAQAERDSLFISAISQNTNITATLATEVKKNTEILISHDATMRVSAKTLERELNVKKQKL